MEVLKDLLYVLKATGGDFMKRWKLLPKIWVGVLLTQAIYAGVTFLLLQLWIRLGSAGLLVGFVQVLVQAGFYSMLLYFFYQAVLYRRVGLSSEEIKASFSHFLRDVYFIMFVRWIVSFLLGARIPASIRMILTIVLFSALPETIYLGSSHREGMFLENFEFLKNNWALWIPLAVLWHLIQNKIFRVGYLLTWYDFISPYRFIRSGLYLAVFSAVFMYRGILYQLLNSSNPRKRKFMREF